MQGGGERSQGKFCENKHRYTVYIRASPLVEQQHLPTVYVRVLLFLGFENDLEPTPLLCKGGGERNQGGWCNAHGHSQGGRQQAGNKHTPPWEKLL